MGAAMIVPTSAEMAAWIAAPWATSAAAAAIRTVYERLGGGYTTCRDEMGNEWEELCDRALWDRAEQALINATGEHR